MNQEEAELLIEEFRKYLGSKVKFEREYDLNFAEAMNEMNRGRCVECSNSLIYRVDNVSYSRVLLTFWDDENHQWFDIDAEINDLLNERYRIVGEPA